MLGKIDCCPNCLEANYSYATEKETDRYCEVNSMLARFHCACGNEWTSRYLVMPGDVF